MLTSIFIQNYTLIRELNIDFRQKLNIITGETGTGKSIMLGALGLILGNRADTSVMLDDTKKCIVEGKFDIEGYDLQSFFETHELDWDKTTLLRREINPGGKSRAFINDTPVNLNALKELGEQLIDIHSQHQNTRLAEPAFQLSLLDSLADNKKLLTDYKNLYKQYRKTLQKLLDLKTAAARSQKDYDYHFFQFNELTSANLISGELESIEEEVNLLTHAGNIQQFIEEAKYLLYEDEQSIYNKLSSLKKQLQGLVDLNSTLKQFFDRLENLSLETRELSREMDGFSNISMDEKRLEELNGRLHLLNNLLHKHQLRSVQELITLAQELKHKIASVQDLDEEIEKTDQERKNMEGRLEAMANELSGQRKKQVQPVEKGLTALLKQVGIPDAVFKIDLSETAELNENGKNAIEFLFSANKGTKPGPVADQASGGELSRLMLCLKYELADSIFLPTIIFDEIDTGVSGEVAIKVGQMITRLAEQHQVICITHLPQVAAMGRQHFIVYKKSKIDYTETLMRELNLEERVEEIAQMLAGKKPSTIAIENAKELLGIRN